MYSLLGTTHALQRVMAVFGVIALLSANNTVNSAEYPELTGAVVDTANLLSTPAWAELETDLRRHREQHGNHVVVATVTSLDGVNIAQYALGLARHWQLGDAGVDNGVLILVAQAERSMRIEVGYGLENTLSDARADGIIQREMRPAFQSGDYDTGLRRGVSAVLDTLLSASGGSALGGFQGSLKMAVPLAFAGLFALAQVFRKRIGKRTLNTVVISGFIGLFVNLVSNMWYVGVAAGVIAALVLYKRGQGNTSTNPSANNANAPHYDRYHDRHPDRRREPQHQQDARHLGRRQPHRSGGSNSGGGGGGGSFGGGGASGRW